MILILLDMMVEAAGVEPAARFFLFLMILVVYYFLGHVFLFFSYFFSYFHVSVIGQ